MRIFDPLVAASLLFALVALVALAWAKNDLVRAFATHIFLLNLEQVMSWSFFPSFFAARSCRDFI